MKNYDELTKPFTGKGKPLRIRPQAVFFLQFVTAFYSIASMRYRRGRPKAFLIRQMQGSYPDDW